MKQARNRLAPLLLLVAFVTPLSAGGAPRKRAPVRYGIPRLAPGQLWISSVPVGLEVRSSESPISGKVIGRTPLVVEAADVGRFVTVSLLRKEYGADLPHQLDFADFSAKTNHSSVHQVDGKEVDYLRAVTYEVKPARQTLIALFQPRSLPLSKVARLYPPGSSFPFSDGAVSKRLTDYGVAKDSIPEALRLLHRGGKLAMAAGTNWLLVEVTRPGVVEMTDLASLHSGMSSPTPGPTP